MGEVGSPEPAVVPARIKMRRVIPSYSTRFSFLLGLIQAVFGGIILLFAIVNFSIKAFVSAGGSALLASLGLFLCGALGIIASRNKEIWAITVYLLLSIVAVVFNVTLMGAAGVGVTLEDTRPAPIHADVRESIDLVLLITAVVATLSLIWSVVMCSMSLFYGCCKQTSGAQYVSEPKVQYKPEAAPSSESQPHQPVSTGEVTPAVIPIE